MYAAIEEASEEDDGDVIFPDSWSLEDVTTWLKLSVEEFLEEKMDVEQDMFEQGADRFV